MGKAALEARSPRDLVAQGLPGLVAQGLPGLVHKVFQAS